METEFPIYRALFATAIPQGIYMMRQGEEGWESRILWNIFSFVNLRIPYNAQYDEHGAICLAKTEI
jgi:hypothetical protein